MSIISSVITKITASMSMWRLNVIDKYNTDKSPLFFSYVLSGPKRFLSSLHIPQLSLFLGLSNTLFIYSSTFRKSLGISTSYPVLWIFSDTSNQENFSIQWPTFERSFCRCLPNIEIKSMLHRQVSLQILTSIKFTC